ncbi:DUF2063 domain containing protein [Sulfitobacter noctilucae]|uniref:HvfC/BufC N-terminal domain-containing protein n=1 Tax=Sulfitobacter noctilucae TaxID=1342302 RepID=UPI00046AE737|nr:DNA-binding domain-containing protein [Sulfitobacter noctilucae]KIN61653.1 DUF2063 domain containing protein [Sulfitobacter noctilucae]
MTDQASFRQGLLDPAQPAPENLLDGAAAPAGKRYDVYRNNVTHSLIEAMKAAFPLIHKLIGAQNFSTVATEYVRTHPPRSPVMMFYGTEFPGFLPNFPPLAHIGYLADAARLDLALRQSYHAADTAAFDPAPLQTLSPDALMDARVSLAPATRLIASNWPLYDIWAFNNLTNAQKPQSLAQDVMITRPGFDPAPHALPPGAFQWLTALADGSSFGQAHDFALNKNPNFDLAVGLSLALSTHAFAKIDHKELK